LQYRPEKQDYLRTELKGIFRTRTRDEWFDLLSKADVGIGKVLEIDELYADPHVLAREMVLELDHPKFGKVRQTGFGIKLSETPATVRRLPNLPGADTEEVLLESGFKKEEIADFRREDVI
ncbi:MAG: CoA transferase, partial [Chloroflexi bacterium]|nr:CoA transferase [Chloroflexota bacterium]